MSSSTSQHSTGSHHASKSPGGDVAARRILIGLLLGGVLGLAANVLLRPGVLSDGVAAWDLNGDGVHDGLDWFCQNVTTVIGRLGKAGCARRLAGAASNVLAAKRVRRERRIGSSPGKMMLGALLAPPPAPSIWHSAPSPIRVRLQSNEIWRKPA